MPTFYKTINRLLVCGLMLFSAPSLGDTPPGWINSGNVSAYTTNQGELELAVAALAVNDLIDIFDFREDLIANNRRLVGNSGDLDGTRLELHYGITRYLEAFYRELRHGMEVDLGTVNSVNLIDIDRKLETTRQTAGMKWTLYEGNLLNPGNLRTALSLEVSAVRNRTADFDLVLDEIRLPDLTVSFQDSRTFSVADLEDDGWQARLIYTWPMAGVGIGSVWAGYGESDSTSATTSDLTTTSIGDLFEQEFELDEEYLYFGASLNLPLAGRLPMSISYEYVNISSSKFRRSPADAPAQLPGFFRSSGQAGEDENHTLSARISYWLTPDLHLSVSGNFFSNQFLGIIPHYDNPLSESFSSEPYGYAGVELGYVF